MATEFADRAEVDRGCGPCIPGATETGPAMCPHYLTNYPSRHSGFGSIE